MGEEEQEGNEDVRMVTSIKDRGIWLVEDTGDETN
jgi:hypothetical protein